jgi:hypothetical protein
MDENFTKIVRYLKETKIFNEKLVIPGWFDINDMLCFYIISCLQKHNNITGNATEIGVHYGKCSIFLSNLYFNKVFGVDIFEHRQSENISNSGNGNLAVFRQLLTEYGNVDKVTTIVKNSSELTISDTYDNILFHIDGGHSFNEVKFDLNFAKKTLKDDGVIIMDDSFSWRYPDVSIALSLFLIENEEFVPFLITPAKLYICKKQYSNFYIQFFKSNDNLKKFGFVTRSISNKILNNEVVTIPTGNKLFVNDCPLIKLI